MPPQATSTSSSPTARPPPSTFSTAGPSAESPSPPPDHLFPFLHRRPSPMICLSLGHLHASLCLLLLLLLTTPPAVGSRHLQPDPSFLASHPIHVWIEVVVLVLLLAPLPLCPSPPPRCTVLDVIPPTPHRARAQPDRPRSAPVRRGRGGPHAMRQRRPTDQLRSSGGGGSEVRVLLG